MDHGLIALGKQVVSVNARCLWYNSQKCENVGQIVAYLRHLPFQIIGRNHSVVFA